MSIRNKMLPALFINPYFIEENTRKVVDQLAPYHIDLTAVTKCAGGHPEVAEAFIRGGAHAIGDSRLYNFKNLDYLDIPKWLIRIPMKSEAEDVIRYSDLSLNSEVKTLEEINYYAQKYNKSHEVLLMIDHGDLREGWFDLDEFHNDLKRIKKLDHIKVKGIGTNSNCAGAVIPEPSSFKDFPKILTMLQNELDINNPVVSGGNSGAYYMIEDGTIPKFINNLRIGELLLFGQETSFQKQIQNLHHDIFRLDCEIIEIKEKPSLPIGKHGKDAFGKEPVFEDLGIRKRAIVAIGKQDDPPEDLIPYDPDINIVTASSDHLILDLTDSKKSYEIGDIISFHCNYSSALRASTSDYVNKIIV